MSATTITVADESPRRQYTATGGQTVFDFPIPFFEEEDLTVYLTPVGNVANDTNDLLTLTTNYTVNGENTQNGGEIVLVVGATAGDIITIERVVPIERTADFQTSGDLLAETLNTEQDETIFIAQQLRQLINRGLRFQATSTTQSALLVANPNTGKGLIWDANGNLTNTTNNVDDIVVDATAAKVAAQAAQTAAEAAQTAAETAETNAAASFDSFDDRYLGAKASDPTLDNDGNALIDGALYFNTTTNEMRVYDLGTTSWLPATNITKATQAEAEAGTDNLTFMTPLRTEQAIDLNAVDQDSNIGAANLPTGTTAQRPVTPAEGMFRRNSETGSFEGYTGTEWAGVGGASGGAGNPFIYENDTNVTSNYTITTGKNAMSAGPITINTGVTVSVPSGSVWTIV